LGQPKIWFGRPEILVVLALTKCLVESTKLSNQTSLVEIQPNWFGWTVWFNQTGLVGQFG
jgi:hypothetical protein